MNYGHPSKPTGIFLGPDSLAEEWAGGGVSGPLASAAIAAINNKNAQHAKAPRRTAFHALTEAREQIAAAVTRLEFLKDRLVGPTSAQCGNRAANSGIGLLSDLGEAADMISSNASRMQSLLEEIESELP